MGEGDVERGAMIIVNESDDFGRDREASVWPDGGNGDVDNDEDDDGVDDVGSDWLAKVLVTAPAAVTSASTGLAVREENCSPVIGTVSSTSATSRRVVSSGDPSAAPTRLQRDRAETM